MRRLILCFLLMSGSVFAQGQVPTEKVKKEVVSLQNSVNDVVNTTIAGFGLLQGAKGTYLDGYGVVLTVEVALEPPRNPFTGIKSPAEVRTSVTQHHKEIVEKLTALLKQRTPNLESLIAAESVTIIVYILNTNPADLPDLPTQMVFTAKKQATAEAFISFREY